VTLPSHKHHIYGGGDGCEDDCGIDSNQIGGGDGCKDDCGIDSNQIGGNGMLAVLVVFEEKGQMGVVVLSIAPVCVLV
jgi:hypothetical protein